MITEERFWSHVDRRGPDECWPWIGSSFNNKGYGRLPERQGPGVRKSLLAHRLAYQFSTTEPIPKSRCVLHRCDYRKCCNPRHLFLGSIKDNNQDMWAKGRGKAPRKEICKRGHRLEGDNLGWFGDGRWRYCKACRAAHTKAYRQARLPHYAALERKYRLRRKLAAQ